MPRQNLEKRIKRHITGRTHPLFAAAAPGTEDMCAKEMAAVLDTVVDLNPVPGGVEFEGRLTDVYRANLDLRIPLRITVRIARFRASNFRQFEKHIALIPWELHIKPDTVLRTHVKTIHSRLYHTTALSDHLHRAAAGGARPGKASQPDPDTGNAVVQNLFARAVDDRFTISLDSTGDLLYKRGLKTGGGRAPIRETLAAAALKWAGFTGREPLIDPMCGSGTFSLEAAMVAGRVPPGWYRDFTFMNWPAFREKQWRHLKKERSKRITAPPFPIIFAGDIDPQACKALKSTVRRFDLSRTIRVTQADFFHLEPQKVCPQAGVLTLNPPFGVRLGSVKKSRELYTEIASKIKKDYTGWRAAIFISDKRALVNFPSNLKRRAIRHGGLELTLLTGRIE